MQYFQKMEDFQNMSGFQKKSRLLKRSIGFSFSVFSALITPLVAGLVVLMSAPVARAAGPGFQNLTQGDFDNAIRELSANSTYHSVTGAGTLGTIFGFEVAVVGGLTTTPEINSLSKKVDASADVGRLPHAALLLGASIPLGITGEIMFFPDMTFSTVKYSQFGASLKYTTSPGLLPFNLAVRGFVTSNKMSFDQTLNGSNVTVTQENSQTGLQLLASPSLPMVEPYVGIGLIKANGKMAVTGASTIFAFTSAQSAESAPTATQFLLGVNVNLLLVNLGAEYSNAFGTSSYNAKLGLRF
jgi:hypothetical protein